MRKFLLWSVAIVLAAVLFASCNVTRMVPDDEYLLRRNETVVDDPKFDKGELTAYYRQKENRNVFRFYPFFLATYNFAHIGHERKWKNWLARVVGEEPVIYDSVLAERTVKQFDIILRNAAYYNSSVSYDVKRKKKKAKVTYAVNLGNPTYINSVYYTVRDTVLTPIIWADTAESLLRPGKKFTLSDLQAERDRIVTQVRSNGYYMFSSDMVKYSVDTSNYLADVEVIVDRPVVQNPDGYLEKANARQYRINSVSFFPDYNPQKVLRDRSAYYANLDTLRRDQFLFLFSDKPKITPRTILKANMLEPGELYDVKKVDQTSRHISSLRIFRQNNISFTPVVGSDTLLDCSVQLTPSTYQNYSVNLEATNTEGNLGVGGNLNYQHKNLFHGAEIFNVRLSGALQRQTETETTDAFNIVEFGAESSLETPSFVLPFRTSNWYKRIEPRTLFTVAYNYQRRPDYTRKITSLLVTYSWKTTEHLRFLVSPVDLNTVRIPKRTEAFDKRIQGKYIENSYKDYFIIGSRYSILYQNRNASKQTDFSYFRWNVELAGNLLNLLHKNMSRDTVSGGYYELVNLQYAQFVRTDVDFRRYHFFSDRDQLVSRIFMGVAIPYGNATAVPFVRQYYSGGADGIRAWNVRDLGPGTYRDTASSYPNQTADVKMEFNLEYRYTIIKNFKGALFADVGNIWALKEDEDRPGAEFNFDKFYTQLAVGTGMGFRLDLNFAVIRLDAGIKVRNPAIEGPDSWVLFHNRFRLKSITWQFGIGYPF
ncbi:MAG: BamA/TamA family outer membrane protein [Salinivirgaceae bacterium]|nr:BamA/TamA family outer membrane protein [Salinivirgaceae bacterium]